MPKILFSSSIFTLLASLIPIFALFAKAAPKIYFSGVNTPSAYYSFSKDIPTPNLRFSLVASGHVPDLVEN